MPRTYPRVYLRRFHAVIGTRTRLFILRTFTLTRLPLSCRLARPIFCWIGSPFIIKMSSTTTAALLPVKKKRYQWIDNSRVIAAFLIMYMHIPVDFPKENFFNNELIKCFINYSAYTGRVPFFLILSGYLYARNAAWSKSFDRFFWLLVPFILWLVLIAALGWCIGMPVPDFQQMFGIGAFFCPDLHLEQGPLAPRQDLPAWYMRDMLFLTLATPIFLYFRRFLPVILAGMLVLYTGSKNMNPYVILAPPTIFFFMVGIYLSRFKVEEVYRILNDRFAPVVILAILVAAGMSIWHIKFNGPEIPVNFAGMFLGAMMITFGGVTIERHLPNISKRLAPLGPASFLVYMLHLPVFTIITRVFPHLPQSPWVLLVPIPVYIAIVAGFLGMKRFTPWLMPYLGHMKIAKKPQAEATK